MITKDVMNWTNRARMQPAPEPEQDEPDDTFNWHFWMWLATITTIIAARLL